MKKEGFTLLELLIVIIIVGILATLAIIQYKPYKENTLDREAQANLNLIYAAERIYKFESNNNVYYSNSANNTNAGINSGLSLQLSTGASTQPADWNYTLTTCTSGGNSRFTAQAQRNSTDPVIARNWCLNSNDPSVTSDPVPSGPNAGTTACTCP